jgi:hypothetical protein
VVGRTGWWGCPGAHCTSGWHAMVIVAPLLPHTENAAGLSWKATSQHLSNGRTQHKHRGSPSWRRVWAAERVRVVRQGRGRLGDGPSGPGSCGIGGPLRLRIQLLRRACQRARRQDDLHLHSCLRAAQARQQWVEHQCMQHNRPRPACLVRAGTIPWLVHVEAGHVVVRALLRVELR